jgi:hypothetical protein
MSKIVPNVKQYDIRNLVSVFGVISPNKGKVVPLQAVSGLEGG